MINNKRRLINIMNQVYEVMRKERDAISIMMENTEQYDEIIDILSRCEGKVIFMGIGKSGHIAEKLAATFSSTGTPSFFVHAAEAHHGDLGMIEKRDIVILMSNSGTTEEVVSNIPFVKAIGALTIAFTSNLDSPLSIGCDYRIIYPKIKEADELNLAPTVSSTLSLVLGDAIACTLSSKKHFTKENFHKFHPGGALGKTLSDIEKRGK